MHKNAARIDAFTSNNPDIFSTSSGYPHVTATTYFHILCLPPLETTEHK